MRANIAVVEKEEPVGVIFRAWLHGDGRKFILKKLNKLISDKIIPADKIRLMKNLISFADFKLFVKIK